MYVDELYFPETLFMSLVPTSGKQLDLDYQKLSIVMLEPPTKGYQNMFLYCLVLSKDNKIHDTKFILTSKYIDTKHLIGSEKHFFTARASSICALQLLSVTVAKLCQTLPSPSLKLCFSFG